VTQPDGATAPLLPPAPELLLEVLLADVEPIEAEPPEDEPVLLEVA
jgi:hypothetical protein